MPLHGFVGKAGSGKNSVGSVFTSLKHSYVIENFADNIRKHLEIINPLVYAGFRLNKLLEAFNWEQLKNGLIHPDLFLFFLKSNEIYYASKNDAKTYVKDISLEIRRLLQQDGEGSRDVFGNDLWVNKILPQPLNCSCVNAQIPWESIVDYYDKKYPKDLIIADVRRLYEADRIKQLGGYIGRIVNPKAIKDSNAQWRQHVTETESDLIKADYIIEIDFDSGKTLLSQVIPQLPKIREELGEDIF